MRMALKDYQETAVGEILKSLGFASMSWHQFKNRSAFSLSAPTGAGKTIIAGAVIESLLRGNPDFDFEADPSAVVLWVSKDPALNEQTHNRFVASANRLESGQFVLLDKDFGEDSLQRGMVYFINPSKLSKSAGFVKRTDERPHTFWDILRTTIEDPDKTLYMILDEAHEGMRPPTDNEQTIVQRIINGDSDHPAVPIVLGISATVRRFDEAMEKAKGFNRLTNVEIPSAKVQGSGLLKEKLALDIPDEKGKFDYGWVYDAAVDFADVCEQWDAYSVDQELEHPVVPLLVVQIPDRPTGERDTAKGQGIEDATIAECLARIRKGWPGLTSDCVAHVIPSRGTIEVSGYEIPRVSPPDVQSKTWIRVLFAKQSVSAGWDCPRAEVLVSLRPASDSVYIAQLIGRMVRTPLARSTSVERLNAVSCYLPKFDRKTTELIADELTGKKVPRWDVPSVPVEVVLTDPVMLERSAGVPVEAVEAIEALPSYCKPAKLAKPIRRALKASQALARDSIVPDADKSVHELAYTQLDQIMEAHQVEIEHEAEEIRTADVRRIMVEQGKGEVTVEKLQRAADATTVEDELKALRRLLHPSLVNGYVARLSEDEVAEDPFNADITGIKAKVAALGHIDVDVVGPVQKVLEGQTQTWVASNRKVIAALPDSRQPVYAEIEAMASEPELVPIALKDQDMVDTVRPDGEKLPTVRKHLLVDGDGNYPLDSRMAKNRWERAVLAKELEQAALVCWYRNPGSDNAKDALRIVRKAGDDWRGIQPDFIFIEEVDGQMRCSVVDPHGPQDGNVGPRLKALVNHTDKHRDAYERFYSIGVEKNGVLYALDLKDADVRSAVGKSGEDRDSIEAIYLDLGFEYTTIASDVLG